MQLEPGEFPDTPLLIQSNTGSFDSAGTSLREVPASLRMTVTSGCSEKEAGGLLKPFLLEGLTATAAFSFHPHCHPERSRRIPRLLQLQLAQRGVLTKSFELVACGFRPGLRVALNGASFHACRTECHTFADR